MSEEKTSLRQLERSMIEAELRRESYKQKYRQILKSTVFSLIVVVAAVALVAVLLMPVLQIDGTSMTDTLQDGDIVLALNEKDYNTGDVIAFYYNNDIFVKRVIASAGDWVDIDKDGNVSVNGELIDEPYVTDKALGDCNIELPYQVPESRVFVMGDHRATSIDSRNTAVGCVSSESSIGKILFRVWPISEIGRVK